MPKQMTRLPETPLQKINQQKAKTLARYLMTLSEKRQVMFMDCLTTTELKLAVRTELEKEKVARDRLNERKPEVKKG